MTPEQKAMEEERAKLSAAVSICRQGSLRFFNDPDSVEFTQLNLEVPVEKFKNGSFAVKFQARAKMVSTLRFFPLSIAKLDRWKMEQIGKFYL